MSKFNFLMENGFQGCAILGHRRDTGRNRDVTIYHLKDEVGMVGYFDGVDSFILGAMTAGPDIASLAAEADKGRPFEVEFGQTKRRLNDPEGSWPKPEFIPLPAAQPVAPRVRHSARSTPVRHTSNAVVSMPEVQKAIDALKPVKERRSAHD